MKKFNSARIAILVLSLALLISSVVGITAAAEDASTGKFGNISVAYGDKVAVRVAVDATQAEIESGAVKVTYTLNDTTADAKYFSTDEDGTVWVITEGIAAYDMAQEITFNSYVGETQVETNRTYSVAQFLYAMLYRDRADITDADAAMYSSLIEYGAAAQTSLNKNADKLLTDCTVAYTTYEGATVDGTNKYLFSLPGESFDITPVCGAASVWYAIDADGNRTQFIKSTTVKCPVQIVPLPSHVNVDFESEVTEGVQLYTFAGTTYTSHVEQTTLSTTSSAETYYGVLGKLVDDPIFAGNKVLSIVVNGGVNNSSTGNGGYISTLQYAPASTTDNGKVHIVEFDINLEHANKAQDDPFVLVAYDADGNELFSVMPNGSYDSFVRFDCVTKEYNGTLKNVYHFGNEYAQTAEGTTTSILNAGEWYRVRVSFDQANSKLQYDVSVDGGLTWYLLTADKTSNDYSASEIAKVGFKFTHYGYGYSLYMDNVSYTVADSLPSRNSQIFNDATEAEARK